MDKLDRMGSLLEASDQDYTIDYTLTDEASVKDAEKQASKMGLDAVPSGNLVLHVTGKKRALSSFGAWLRQGGMLDHESQRAVAKGDT
jgi:hypothetical protein